MIIQDFWNPELLTYQGDYFGELMTVDGIADIEAELGYKLPVSYIELMSNQNGGYPKRTCFPTSRPNNWTEGHIALVGIMGIGRENSNTLCGDMGSKFWMEEWGYPDIGVYFADCPTAGHQMFALDYRECGRSGEPKIVYVDQDNDYSTIELAPDFTTFINGLMDEENFQEDG